MSRISKLIQLQMLQSTLRDPELHLNVERNPIVAHTKTHATKDMTGNTQRPHASHLWRQEIPEPLPSKSK